MGIKLVNDLGAPALVTVIDIAVDTAIPQHSEIASYAMAAGGYAGAFLGYGGDFVKNFGIAAFPIAAKKLYTRVKGMGGTTRRVALRQSAPSVSRNYQKEFEAVNAY